LVSVITPTYNRKELLSRAIKSLLKQTYTNFESIVVDDASSDNTKEVVKSFTDERINYIRLPKNKGALGAKNEGIKKARGEIITFLDNDDEFLPDALEKIVDAFNSLKEAKTIFFDCINENGKITGKWKVKNIFVTFPEHLCRKIYGEFLPALRREVFENEMFNEEMRTNPKEFYLRVSKRYEKIYHVPEVCRIYHQEAPHRITGKEHIFKNSLQTAHDLEIFTDEFKQDFLRFCPQRFYYYIYTIGKNYLLGKENKKVRYFFKQCLYHYLNLRVLLKWMLTFGGANIYHYYFRRKK
jgi:glycosyltransferase involved in cell wall biosynthesis